MFNIAIGADAPDIQRTARSALLQMLNTIVKRIAQLTLVCGPFSHSVPSSAHRILAFGGSSPLCPPPVQCIIRTKFSLHGVMVAVHVRP